MKKIAKYLTLALILLAISAFIGAFVALKNLDSPSLKRLVQEKVESGLGVSLDYEHLSVDIFGNLRASGIKIFSPENYKDVEPVLLSVDSIEVGWKIFPLLKGLLDIQSISIKGVKASLVVDENGKSSLDALLERFPKAEEEEKPKFRLSDGLPIKDLHLSVGSLSIEDVAFTQKTLKAGRVHSTVAVEGITLSGSLYSYRRDSSLRLTISSQGGDGLKVSLEDEESKKEALVALSFSLDAHDSLRVSTNLSLKVAKQNIFEVFQEGLDVLDIATSVAFLPDEQKTFVSISNLSLFQGAIKANGEAKVSDDFVPVTISKANLTVDGEKIPKEVLSMLDAKLDGFLVQGEVEDVVFSSIPVVSGKIRVILKSNEVGLKDILFAKDMGLELTFGSDNALHLNMGAGEIFAQNRFSAKGVTISGTVKNLKIEEALQGTFAFGGNVFLTMKEVEVTQPETSFGARNLKLSFSGDTNEREANIVLAFDGASMISGKTVSFPASNISVIARNISLDMSKPLRSSATIKVLGHLGHVKMEGEIKKQGETVHNDLALSLQGLGFGKALVADMIREYDMSDDSLEISLKATGSVQTGSSLSFSQKVAIDLKNLSLQVQKKPVRISEIIVNAFADGDLNAMHVQTTTEVTGAWFAGEKVLESLKLVAETATGVPFPPVNLQVDASSRLLSLHLRAALKERFRNLSLSLDLKPKDIKRLFELARFTIEGVDPERLRGSLHLEGNLVADVPLMLAVTKGIEALRGNVLAQLAIEKASYDTKALSVSLKDASAQVKVAFDQSDVNLEIDAKPGELKADTRQNTFALEDAQIAIRANTKKRFEESDAEVSVLVQARKVEQNISPVYAIGNVVVSLKARMEKMDRFILEEMTIRNEEGGTILKVGARAEEVARSALIGLENKLIGRRGLLLEGVLEQELSKLQMKKAGMVASGKIRMPFLLQSGDRRVYRVSTELEAQSVSLAIPDVLQVSNLSGRIPVLEEIVLADGKPTLVLQNEPNLYSLVRFFDQQPFLPSRGFFVCDNLQVGQVTLGALAGNIEINKNMISIDQLEAGWRGGKISGQVILDILPSAPYLLFRGRVTGIYAKSGDRFDANAALAFAIRSLELDGRIHLVRIGRDNLLELLDAFDPYREDVAMNRVRLALKLAYPKSLVLKAEGGYISAKVELGGLGSMVRIDEIRGVPVTPLLRRYLGSLVEGGAL